MVDLSGSAGFSLHFSLPQLPLREELLSLSGRKPRRNRMREMPAARASEQLVPAAVSSRAVGGLNVRHRGRRSLRFVSFNSEIKAEYYSKTPEPKSAEKCSRKMWVLELVGKRTARRGPRRHIGWETQVSQSRTCHSCSPSLHASSILTPPPLLALLPAGEYHLSTGGGSELRSLSSAGRSSSILRHDAQLGHRGRRSLVVSLHTLSFRAQVRQHGPLVAVQREEIMPSLIDNLSLVSWALSAFFYFPSSVFSRNVLNL